MLEVRCSKLRESLQQHIDCLVGFRFVPSIINIVVTVGKRDECRKETIAIQFNFLRVVRSRERHGQKV